MTLASVRCRRNCARDCRATSERRWAVLVFRSEVRSGFLWLPWYRKPSAKTPRVSQTDWSEDGIERKHSSKGNLVRIKTDNSVNLAEPPATINQVSPAGQHHFAVFAPLDRNHTTRCVDVNAPIGFFVYHGSDHRRARTGA